MLNVDPLKLTQAMRSIILTSSKMTRRQGHVTVHCGVYHREPENNTEPDTASMIAEMHIEIMNDGEGITKVFDN